MSRRVAPLPVIALLILLLCPLALLAAGVDKELPYALDQWIELKTTEGPVTLHRIRLASQSGVTKSKILRPGNSKFAADVQIQLEYSNEATNDWEAAIRFEWLDSAGVVIDGYDGNENLDNEAKYDQQTMTISTLRYGLDRAKKMRIHITVAPD